MLKVDSIKQLVELYKLNWNNPYTERNFKVFSKKQFEYIIRNYKNNFAFGVSFGKSNYTIMKIIDYPIKLENTSIDEDGFYIRKDKNKDDPPVTTLYDLKSDNIEDIIQFIYT